MQTLRGFSTKYVYKGIRHSFVFSSLFTIFTTSMIYAQLKTVPSWNNILTPSLFIFAALASGAILLTNYASLVILLVFGTLQILFWYVADQGFKDKEKYRYCFRL